MNILKKISLILLLIAILLSLLIILSNSNKFLSENDRKLIRKYILPYKYSNKLENINDKLENINDKLRNENLIEREKFSIEISALKKEIRKRKQAEAFSLDLEQKPNIVNLIKEIRLKENLDNIITDKYKKITLENDLILKKYKFINGLTLGAHYPAIGGGYIDFHNHNLILSSLVGSISFVKVKDEENLVFKQIPNNIDFFLNIKHFVKNRAFTIKDILINNDKIYVSYTGEVDFDCWNTSVLVADMNYKFLEFKKLFFSDQCVHAVNNEDAEFAANQAGGRIENFNNEEILLTIGEFKSRYLAQQSKSIFGKIIKINKFDKSYNIISMGHRNPQGLLFDKKSNIIMSTEHGPRGGDEINIIKRKENLISNYGWPIASYGEHYTGKADLKKYKKYPLKKSHKENGFIEPLKYFVPSIAISEIEKIGDRTYVLTSLKAETIYFFKLDKNYKIIEFTPIVVGERIRDIFYKDKTLYLFLESTSSLGVIKI